MQHQSGWYIKICFNPLAYLYHLLEPMQLPVFVTNTIWLQLFILGRGHFSLVCFSVWTSEKGVFVLVPFVKESQTSGRSSASIAHLPPPQRMVNTMIWTSPNNWAEHHVTCPGIPEFEQWACRFLPFLWHPLHLNKETCVKALKKEIISFKVREIML